jgi:hypothetical protein
LPTGIGIVARFSTACPEEAHLGTRIWPIEQIARITSNDGLIRGIRGIRRIRVQGVNLEWDQACASTTKAARARERKRISP